MAWPFMDPMERLSYVVSDIYAFQDDLIEARRVQSQCDGELNDIAHEMELEDLTDQQLLERAQRMVILRRLRREAKDAIIVLDPLMKAFEKFKMQSIADQCARTAENAACLLKGRRYMTRACPPEIQGEISIPEELPDVCATS